MKQISRRAFIAGAAAAWLGAGSTGVLADGAATQPAATAAATAAAMRYRISACDWILLKRQKVGAIQLARECGIDGVEVDMGSLGDRPDFKNALLKPEVVQQYKDACVKYGVAISSVAMSAFYGQSWADHPACDALADEWVEVMNKLGVKVGFLPMGSKSDIKNDAAERGKVMAHLKRLAPNLEKAGIVIGIEASLDTDGYKRFLDDVGSAAVRLSYNFGDQEAAGEDVYSQVRDLGKDRIVEIHCTEKDGAWLGQGKLDVPKMKGVLDAIGWSGWLTIERSRVKGKSVKENFSANAAYLKSIFQAGAA